MLSNRQKALKDDVNMQGNKINIPSCVPSKVVYYSNVEHRISNKTREKNMIKNQRRSTNCLSITVEAFIIVRLALIVESKEKFEKS